MGELSAKRDAERLLAEAGWMKGLAARLLREAGDPEDLVQDTWVAALESDRPIPGRRGVAGMRAWLAAVVRNLALRRRRQAGTRRHHELRAAREREAGAQGDELERVEMHRLLAEELLALEEPYRTAVILRHLDGLRYPAVARRQGITEAAARQRVSRGLARLRARLERRFKEGEGSAVRALLLVARHAPWIRGGLWTGGVVMGAKGIGAGVVAAGAVALVVWSTREGRPDVEPPVSGAEPAVAAATVSGPSSVERLVVEPAAVDDGEDASAPAARRAAAGPAGERAASGRVRVTDREGRGLAGAWVRRADAASEADVAVADEDGRARLPLGDDAEEIAEGRIALELLVGCEGYLERSVFLDSLDPLEVALLALPCVHGRLSDPMGLPVTARARVRIGVLAERSSELEILATETDGEGDFRLASLPLGRLRWISGMAEGFVETREELDLALEPEADEQVDLSLEAGFLVEGVVLDATTDQPLPGAFVWTDDFFWDESDLGPTATTDAGGRFRLEGVRVFRQTGSDGLALAVMRIFVRTETHAAVRDSTLAPWRDDGHYEIVLRIEPTACSIAGVLREPGGAEPAAGVPLFVVDARRKVAHSRTDGEGRFRFEGLPPGPLELFSWQGPLASCRTVAASLALEPGGHEELALELVGSDRSRLEGRLQDPGDEPVAGTTVECTLFFRQDTLTIGSLGKLAAVTDAGGRFVFADLPPGRYAVHPGGLSARTAEPAEHELVLARDEVVEDLDFTVGASATFAGTLTSGSGDLSGLRVRLVYETSGAELESTRPDGQGRFLFRPVLAGRYAIQVLRGEEVVLDVPVGPDGDTDLPLFVP